MSRRQKNDWYPTPSYATQSLLDREKFESPIREPACGDGAISKVLEKNGYSVISSDLFPYGYAEYGIDFTARNELHVGAKTMITNPPFKLANAFVFKSIQIYDKFALFLRLSYLEGQERYKKIYKETPPSRVWVFSKRLTLWRGDEERNGNGTQCYAWFVWDKKHTDGVKLDWIC
jgi:hypothetical protein